MSVKHAKVVSKPDGPDTSKLRPSDWNADHLGTNIHDHSNDDNGGLISGVPGVPGPQGLQGEPGATGEQGPQGIPGLQGPIGNDGQTGPQGIQGEPGVQGVPGIQGPPGADGSQGLQGIPGADSVVPGPAGPKGDQGIQGIQGLAGADSTVPGPQGVKGDTGNTGPAGADSTVPGPQGPAGTTRYAINIQALTSSPGDGATVYFGVLPKAPIATANVSRVYFRSACTIKRAEIYNYSGTAGTGENWSLYIRKNATTDTLVATVGAAANMRVFSNTALDIAIVSGDYIEMKSVQPTWATNPLTCIWGGYLIVEE